jgi:hypothetical protein
MADIKAGVLLSLKDQFSRGINGAGAAVKDFGSTALGAVDKVNRAFSGLAGTLGTLGVTIGVGAAVKTYIDLDERMVRLGAEIGITADKTNELKRNLYEVAQDPSIKMGTDSLLEAMETFSGKNFDADVIQDNLRNIGIVMKATGATGEEAANFFIESFKRGMNKDEIMKSLDDMSVIGDELHNQFDLSDFTKAFSGLEATNTLLGKSAMNTTELFTAMNILGAGTKSPARAVSAYNAIVNELADPRKQELLWKLGIAVREGGTGEFRNLADILKEIAATDAGTGNFDTLSTVFSGAAMDAIFAYNQFGHLADGLENIGDTSGDLEREAAKNASSLKSNLVNLQTAFMGFADKNLTGPLERLTEFLNKLAEDPERVEKYIRNIAIGIAALGAVKIGAGVVSFIANLKGIRGGKIDLAGAAGGGAGIPVHVTNWGGTAGSSSMPGLSQGLPGASVGKTPAGQPAGTSLAKAPMVSGRMMATGGAAGGIAAAVVAVPQMVGELNAISQDESLTNKERGRAKGGAIGDASGKIIGGAVGGAAGIAAGAAAGAAIGTIVPGLGTAIGALVGAGIGALGMWAGSKAGRAIGEGIGEAVAKEDIPKILADDINAVPGIPQGGGNPVLEGSASMDINVLVGDDRARTSIAMRRNTLPVQVNTGSAQEARGYAL